VTDIRHKRDTNARTIARTAVLISAPIATLATIGAVTLGVMTGTPETQSYVGASADLNTLLTQRGDEVSRDGGREGVLSPAQSERQPEWFSIASEAAQALQREQLATKRALANAHQHLWVTTALNVWDGPEKDAVLLGELDAGSKILVTGRKTATRTEIVFHEKSRWVTSGYLTDEKPIAAAAGLSMAPCPDPSVENGLTSAAVYVYRSVCHAFPQITSYGGWDAHGEHSSGRALDIMTSDVALGTAIAEFLQAHAAELHLYDILWRQRIWTPVRASEGWRPLSDRGSATANHYDHVHVSVY
jgi:hypothetical protein